VPQWGKSYPDVASMVPRRGSIVCSCRNQPLSVEYRSGNYCHLPWNPAFRCHLEREPTPIDGIVRDCVSASRYGVGYSALVGERWRGCSGWYVGAGGSLEDVTQGRVDMSDDRSRLEREDDQDRDVVAPGQFVSGGYRPTHRLPADVPAIADVKPDSTFQAADGSLWKACGGEILNHFAWRRALIVTPEEHRSTVRWDWALLLTSVGLIGLAGVATFGLGLLRIGSLMIVLALLVFWRWHRVRRTVIAHVVAPGMEDIHSA